MAPQLPASRLFTNRHAVRLATTIIAFSTLAACQAGYDVDLGMTGTKANALAAADADAPDGARFRVAAGCPACEVLAIGRLNLPHTGVHAASAKLRAPDGNSFTMTLRSNGAKVDEQTLLAAEKSAMKGSGKLTPELRSWAAGSAGGPPRAWCWIWTTAEIPPARREDLLASKSAAAAHEAKTKSALASSAAVRAWLAARSIEQGDQGGPMVRAHLSPVELGELEKLPEVAEIGVDAYPGKREGAPWSATSQWGPTIRLDGAHILGQGSGTKLCIKEDTQPDTYARLNVAAVANLSGPSSGHTRAAAGIVRNHDASAFPWLSAAPSAGVYIANWLGYNGSVDTWCQTQGVSNISYSYSVLGGGQGSLGGTDMAHDWLAKTSPYILVVAAAGDKDVSNPNGWYVRNRGYNGLVVGGIDDKNTSSAADDRVDASAAYGNPLTPHNDYELPHVAAPSNGADGAGAGLTGTSAGTSMVAGLGAIIDSIDPNLAPWPEAKRAIIIATATDRAGEGFLTSLPAQTDTKIGAGVVNAQAAAMLAQSIWAADGYGASTIAARGRLARTVTFASSDFGSDGYLVARWKARPTLTGRLRVVLTLDATAACSGGSCSSDLPDADLDLHVFKKTDTSWSATGPLACSSSTWDSTWEMCDFPVASGEEYLITVKKYSNTTASTYMGIAWHSYVPPTAITADGSSALAVNPFWGTEPSGSLTSTSMLDARVQNSTGNSIATSISIVARGFDNRSSTRTISSSTTLAPYETRLLQVPVSSLPIKSVGTEATAEVVVSYTLSGQTHTISSSPLFYQFQTGLGSASFFGLSVNPNTWSPNNVPSSFVSLMNSLFTFEGLMLNAAGTYDDINVVRSGDPPPGGARPAKTEVISGSLDSLGLISHAEAPASDSPTPNTIRICTTFKARFEDSHSEDYYAGPSVDIPARYTSAKVVTTGYALQWQGQLNAAGCTPYLTLPVGNYVLWQEPYFVKDGASFDIFYNNAGGTKKSQILLTGFSRVDTSGPVTVQLRPSICEQTTTVSGVVAQLMNTPDNLLTPGTAYRIHADEVVVDPSGAILDAVVSNGELFLGKNTDFRAAHNAYFKFIVGHELGHLMQDYAFGYPHFSYFDTDGDGTADVKEDTNANGIDDGDEDFDGDGILNKNDTDFASNINPSCSCRHVLIADQRFHCMTGREMDGASRNEGFAHAFAARLWNNASEADCSFTYYKDTRTSDGELFDQWPPPRELNCKGPVKSIGWEKRNCLGSSTAIEHDWLNYHWQLASASSAEATTFSTLADIYRRACAKSPTATSMLCKSQSIHWDSDTLDGGSLRWAAEQVHGLGSAKYNFFRLQATSFGVDH